MRSEYSITHWLTMLIGALGFLAAQRATAQELTVPPNVYESGVTRTAATPSSFTVIFVQDGGIYIGDNVTLNGQGTSFGVYVSTLTSAGTATLNNSAVNVDALGAMAIFATGSTSTATLDGGTVSTTGDGSHGMVATNNGRIIGTASVNTTGAGSHGAFSWQGTIDLGGAVSTTGDGSYGALVGGGTINLNGVAITTQGDNSAGLVSIPRTIPSVVPSHLTGAGTIETYGTSSYGAWSTSGGVMNLTGGTVTTTGAAAFGLYATGANSTIASAAAVSTSGQASYGALVDTGGAINLTGGSIATSGQSAVGLFAYGAGSTISGATDVTTSGAAAHAAVQQDGGILNLTGGTLTANGAGASALFMSNIAGTAGSASLAGVTLASPTKSAITIGGGQATLTLNDVTATDNDGVWLQVSTIDPANPSIADVAADASKVQGAVLTDALSTGSVTFQGGSSWTVTGNSTVTNLTNNASTITFAAPGGDPAQLSSYKAITVTNYGGSGGTIGLNTYLGGDGAPSDQLVVNGGAASGATTLAIANTGGTGALTTGDGILVVAANNGATTAANAFNLGNRVIAGPYEYALFQGSVDATRPQSWYLRSTADCTVQPLPPGCRPSPPPPPGPTPSPSPPAPNYRAETSLYAAIPAMTLIYGRTMLDTLNERMGDERPGIAPGGGAGFQPSLAWGRFIGMGGRQDRDGDGSFGSGPEFDYDIYAFQAGLDLYRADRADGGNDHAGLYFGYGRMTADVTHLLQHDAGKNTIDAYTVGGYWTRFGPTGWYVDAVAQVTWNDIKTEPRETRGLETDGASYALSLETGRPLQVANGFVIEPQAQMIYQSASLGDTSDQAATVVFDNVDSLVGRIGARFAKSFAIDPGVDHPRLATAWLRPSVWYEFTGDPRTIFSSATGFVPFRSDTGGGWAEILAGFDAQVTKSASIYANASYQVGFEGNTDAYGGKIGARISW